MAILHDSGNNLKAFELLNDMHSYRISKNMSFNPNHAVQIKHWNVLRHNATFLQLKPKDWAIARFYGLLTVHKPITLASNCCIERHLNEPRGPLGGRKAETLG